MPSKRVWPVEFDEARWAADLAGATPRARAEAARWRAEVEARGGLPSSHLTKCDEYHDRFPLSNCFKVRIPDPDTADIKRSPWGAVVRAKQRGGSIVMLHVALAQRHPEASGSNKLSVYEIAHRRLNG